MVSIAGSPASGDRDWKGEIGQVEWSGSEQRRGEGGSTSIGGERRREGEGIWGFDRKTHV